MHWSYDDILKETERVSVSYDYDQKHSLCELYQLSVRTLHFFQKFSNPRNTDLIYFWN